MGWRPHLLFILSSERIVPLKHGLHTCEVTMKEQDFHCLYAVNAPALHAKHGPQKQSHLLFTLSTGPRAALNAAASDCTARVRSFARTPAAGPCITEK